jgi:hypothetical protein
MRTVISMRLPTYRWWMVAALAVTSTAGYGVRGGVRRRGHVVQ